MQPLKFRLWLVTRQRKYMETRTHVVHFKWEVTGTLETQAYYILYGAGGRIATLVSTRNFCILFSDFDFIKKLCSYNKRKAFFSK